MPSDRPRCEAAVKPDPSRLLTLVRSLARFDKILYLPEKTSALILTDFLRCVFLSTQVSPITPILASLYLGAVLRAASASLPVCSVPMYHTPC